MTGKFFFEFEKKNLLIASKAPQWFGLGIKNLDILKDQNQAKEAGWLWRPFIFGLV